MRGAGIKPRSNCQHCGGSYANNVLGRHEQQCLTPRTLERLLVISRADTSDPRACWVWQNFFGGETVQYPRLQKVRVHRLACELAHGPSELYALHSCDNMLCLNPHHLRWGTQGENMQDMWDRDRRRLTQPQMVTDDIDTDPAT